MWRHPSFILLLLSPCASYILSQNNASLTLSAKPTAMGFYVSGDIWVQGPITVIATSPPSLQGRHGFEVSPKSTSKQPYDSRAAGYDASLLPQLPLTVSPGDNLVKMVSLDSWPGGGNPTYISSAMIVTVVASPPPEGSYRPAYFRNNSAAAARTWAAGQVNWGLYPSLPLPPAPASPPAPLAQCEAPPPRPHCQPTPTPCPYFST